MCTNTPQWLKSKLTMLECAHMHIQFFKIPPKSTNQALVHLQTPNGLQNFKAPAKLFKTPPWLQNPPKVQTCTSNTQKPSRFLSMHISNQTFNHATRMCGPITYWRIIELEERLRNQKHMEHTSMWTMLGVRYPTPLQPCFLFPSMYHDIDKPYGINMSLPLYSNMFVVLTYLKSTYVFDCLQHLSTAPLFMFLASTS
jgi:hypothetical protein